MNAPAPTAPWLPRIVQVEPGEWHVYLGDRLMGGGTTRALAIRAAVNAAKTARVA